MMTEDIKPLGMSFFQFLSHSPMGKAGGRLLMDINYDLASPVERQILLTSTGKSELLMQAAIRSLIKCKVVDLLRNEWSV